MHHNVLMMVLLCVVCSISCRHDREGHATAVEYGSSSIHYVREFETLFGGSESASWISYYDGYGGQPMWNTFTTLYDRYALTMQFRVTVDRWRDEVGVVGEPHFVLLEITEVEVPKDPRKGIGCKYGENYNFGLKEWETLVKAGGDFSAIDINLSKNSPVTNIEHVKQ
ncbi:hypothetical protein [Bremerella cremea]|uniref:hypothetical protein n=1 Tax=Bremerella cremea TaxID=1031537 RepID=UPI0031E6F88A